MGVGDLSAVEANFSQRQKVAKLNSEETFLPRRTPMSEFNGTTTGRNSVHSSEMASQLVAQILDFAGVSLTHAIVVISAFLATVLYYRQPVGNLPPGPWGVPILGYLPRLCLKIRRGSHPHLFFAELARRYGPVFRIRIINKTVVVLNDFESVRQAFQNRNLCDRPSNTMIAEGMKSEGVAMSSGEKWKDLRRFSLTVLRSLGVGKSSFEEQISTEATALVQEMSSYEGNPFNPRYLFGNATSNVICSAVLGQRYEYSDVEFSRLMRVVHQMVDLVGSGGLLNAIPAMRVFMINKAGVVACFGKFRKFLKSVVASHQSDLDTTNLRDFVDAYLKEIDDNERAQKDAARPAKEMNGHVHSAGGSSNGFTSNGSPRKNGHVLGMRHPYLSHNNIIGTLGNLFVAGSETTSTALQWCILYMAAFPEIQQRVQSEIDAVVGRNRLPMMADKPQLNLVQAILWEVQRISTVAPLGLPHAASQDSEVLGYRIPKGTIVLSNLWALFHDPKVWPEPDKFKPERFLDKDGVAVQSELLIPFSTGRRSCIGEHLAKMEVFIFFSHFMHQFTFCRPENTPPYTLEARVGLTNYPAMFQICAVRRD